MHVMRSRSAAVAGLLIGLFLRTVVAQPADAPADFGYDPAADFVAFKPDYRQLKRAARDRYEQLKRRMNEAEGEGRDTNCSKQVLDEAKWLLHYTADFDRLNRRLDDLAAVLDAPKDPHRKGQTPADGSFGCCSTEWFFRLVITDDELLIREFTFRPLKAPLTLLDRVNDPTKIVAHLESLLVSDVDRTGVDHRYELSLTASILTRMLMWEIPSNYPFHPGVKEALLRFEDDKWQDPDTGFWGAWYRTRDGRVVKTSDLSTTFHFVHYREGDVKRWPQIVKTTLAMRALEYPHGWLEDGKMSNHHNYDVVAILRRGWRHMDESQRQLASAEIAKMLDFCLTQTLNPDGSFKLLADETTLAGAYLFGVSFLSECGYFGRPFWTKQTFPEAAQRKQKIRDKILSLGSSDAELRLALFILATSN